MASSLDKLTPNDPRVTEHTTTLSTGRTYYYVVLPPPQDTPLKGTILLVHGFPDLPLGWRYQAPKLAALGLRVVMPAMLGYSRTDAPIDPNEYSFRRLAGDLAALAKHVTSADNEEKKLPVLLGGHDWGGPTVWNTARLYPDVFSAVFGVCVPYQPPMTMDISYEVAVSLCPTLGYMLQYNNPGFAAKAGKNDETIRNFLTALHSTGAGYFSPQSGVKDGVLDEANENLIPPPNMDKDEMDYYVQEYARSGMGGMLCYYQNRRANYEADLADAEAGKNKISIPALFVMATHDGVVTEDMCKGKEEYFTAGYEVKPVPAGHWLMVAPGARDEVADILTGWVKAHL